MRRLILLATALAFVAAGWPCRAEPSWAEQQSAACTVAIGAAEARRGTLPGLLLAIAKSESGRPVPPLPGLQPWPWAINADGGAYYFDSKGAAVAWVQAALDRGVRQIDVGCMQINLQSHPGAFPDLDHAFDPAANADYAARFLLRLRDDAGGNWWEAIGHYHSHTPALADDYRERVSAIAQNRVPPSSLLVPLWLRAVRQGTLRIPLLGGKFLRINTSRQPARVRQQVSACRVARVLGDYLPARARSRC